MLLNFENRKIIVTGAATGIVRATAEALTYAGASLALWDIAQTACADFSNSASSKSIALEVDVSNSFYIRLVLPHRVAL